MPSLRNAPLSTAPPLGDHTTGHSPRPPASLLLAMDRRSVTRFTPDDAMPDSSRSTDTMEDADITDIMDALVTPTECTPIQLSFGCLGPLSADTQVFRLRNVCGQKVEVRDATGSLFLKGTGHFKPVGYHFDFFDPAGVLAFSVATAGLRDEEVYEFIDPHEMVVATAMRKRFKHRTEIRVGANNRKLYTPVEVECKSVPRQSLLGGRYQVATPSGNILGTIHRHFRKGVVTHQNFTMVVGPEVDPHLMVFLTVVCNCINNERSKLGWALGATGLASFVI